MQRRWVWTLLVFLAALLPAPLLAQQVVPSRIVAVGDLHGDFEAWRAIAQGAGLVDRKGKWTGGRTTLVQLGDVTDRGPDSLKIIRDLMRLQKEAARKGGQVVVLVGNHEAMNMTDDLRYVHPGEFAAFADGDSKRRRDLVYDANKPAIEAAYRKITPDKSSDAIRAEWMQSMPLGKLEHSLAWAPDGELGRWMIGNPAVAKIGTTLFVHGGISSAYAAMSIDDINRRVREALKARDEAPTAIINDERGPLWYRGLVTRSPEDQPKAPVASRIVALQPLSIDDEIDAVLKAYGATRIVVAHTPSLSGIVASSNNRLWRADSGNGRAYGGTPSYLEIVGDRAVAHAVPRPGGK